MARGENERLLVTVEARVSQLEKEMKRATRVTDKTMSDMEKRAKKAAKEMDQSMAAGAASMAATFKNFGKGLLAGAIAGGVTGIAAQIGAVASEIATVGDEARRAGVSAEAFQKWRFVAEQNRIGIDAMVDGLKELQLRADEFIVTGAGAGAEAFGRLGFSAADLAKRLEDPSALMLEIIGRLGDLDRAAQIRVADEVFGGSAGERFVELIAQGEAGIRRTMDRAQELGLVLDQDVIKKAEEVNRRFNEISNTVGMTLKSAIVSAADSLIDFINAFRGFEAQKSSALQGQVDSIMRERAGLVDELNKLKSGEDLSPVARDLGFGPATEEAKRQIAEVQARIDALGVREDALIAELSKRVPGELPKPTDRTWTPVAAPAKAGGGSSRSTAVSDIQRQRDAVRELIADLERELTLVGATDLERETSNLLREAGAVATDEQRAKIVALTAALHAEEAAQRRATEAAQEMADIGRDVLGGMITDLRQGKNAADVFANALDRIADRLASMALDGLFGGRGGGGGLFGSLFGGLFGGGASGGPPLKLLANGGYVRGPGTSRSDSIPARLSNGEFVVNAAATRQHGALLEAINNGRAVPARAVQSGGGVAVSFSPVTNVAAGVTAPELRAVIEKNNAQWRQALPAMIREAANRRKL